MTRKGTYPKYRLYPNCRGYTTTTCQTTGVYHGKR